MTVDKQELRKLARSAMDGDISFAAFRAEISTSVVLSLLDEIDELKRLAKEYFETLNNDEYNNASLTDLWKAAYTK